MSWNYSVLVLGLLSAFATPVPSVCRAQQVPNRPAVHHVFVRSYDGAYIPAAWRKPRGNGPFPAVLYIHGGVGGSGPQAAARMLQGRVPRHFHDRGYVGLATDYRQFHFGEDDIQDVLAAYGELKSLPFVDKNGS